MKDLSPALKLQNVLHQLGETAELLHGTKVQVLYQEDIRVREYPRRATMSFEAVFSSRKTKMICVFAGGKINQNNYDLRYTVLSQFCCHGDSDRLLQGITLQ